MLNLSILMSTAVSRLVRAAPVFKAWATVKLASSTLWPEPPFVVILAISASIFFFFSSAFFSLCVKALTPGFSVLDLDFTVSSSGASLSLPPSSLASGDEGGLGLLLALGFSCSLSAASSSSLSNFSAIFLAFSFLFDFLTGCGSGSSSSEDSEATGGGFDLPFLAGLSSASIKFANFSSTFLSSSPQSSSCFLPFFPFLGGIFDYFTNTSLVEVN